MRKQGADQLYCTADQRLCFLLNGWYKSPYSKIQIVKLLAFSVTVQAGLCRIWSETLTTGFLSRRGSYDKFRWSEYCCVNGQRQILQMVLSFMHEEERKIISHSLHVHGFAYVL